MAYSICKKCECFFKQNGKSYCEKCDHELSDSREKINNYLEINPNASIIEIVKEANVSLKDVNIFLERGGAVSVDFSPKNTINLREEEIRKEDEDRVKKESIKMKNKFTPRRLKR